MLIAIATCFLTFCFSAQVSAQTDATEASRLAKFKAVFMYNFIEYVKWPETVQEGPLILCVFGESEVTPFLERIVAKRKAGKRPIELKTIQPGESDLPACHLLFVPNSLDHFAQFNSELMAKHVLVVGDEKNATAKGASINFTLVEGKLKFEINLSALEQSGPTMSSQLLKLGLLVE